MSASRTLHISQRLQQAETCKLSEFTRTASCTMGKDHEEENLNTYNSSGDDKDLINNGAKMVFLMLYKNKKKKSCRVRKPE